MRSCYGVESLGWHNQVASYRHKIFSFTNWSRESIGRSNYSLSLGCNDSYTLKIKTYQSFCECTFHHRDRWVHIDEYERMVKIAHTKCQEQNSMVPVRSSKTNMTSKPKSKPTPNFLGIVWSNQEWAAFGLAHLIQSFFGSCMSLSHET